MKSDCHRLLPAFLILLLLPFPARSQQAPQGAAREKLSLDRGWKFHLGNAAVGKDDFDYGLGELFAKAGEGAGAVTINFPDSDWRTVDLPHDWAVEQEFVNVKDDGVMSHGYKPIGRQFPETTVGWYRRSFRVPGGDEGKRLVVKFDGVFRDCIVWLNGHYLLNNLSGYSEFTADITDYVRYGQKNVLVVRVDASLNEGWFYEGAGIYRHVWLMKYDPVHVPEYGIFVRSEMKGNVAEVVAETDIVNEQQKETVCALRSVIVDQQNRVVAEATSEPLSLKPFGRANVVQKLQVESPLLWSLENPHLYRLISRVSAGEKLLDGLATSFGIRTVRFDKDEGFLLNGKRVEIQGVCCHQDHAGVGSALPDRLQYYRIGRLKEMGCNAYRTSHNPPTIELLEACDRLGMLVMDENRLMGTSPEMMRQFETLVRRDRNHPSVIIWSLGNEEHTIQNTDVGKRIALSLMRTLDELDPTRLCTYAANNGNAFEGINSVIPVRGFNYMTISDIDKYRKDHPDQMLLGSEEASTLCTRGIYADDTLRGYMSDCDAKATSWGATAEKWWTFYAARPWLAGAFVWTGFDYRGEPTPYQWPCINSHFGIMDVCGFAKTNFFYYQAWWSGKDVLHLAPHWNWKGKEGHPLTVWCNSNADSVELFLNGRSLGIKKMATNSHLEWNVPYEPGRLEAKGWRGARVLSTKVETTGEPIGISLSPDRVRILADGEDVSVVTVAAVDAQGREVPVAGNLVRFEAEGKGRIIGVGNGDPSSHEADKYLEGGWKRSLFGGRCQVILQSTLEPGALTLHALSDGLKSATVSLRAEAATVKPSLETYAVELIPSRAKGKRVEYKHPYSQQYPAGGAGALVDGMVGSADFRDGCWQGFEGNDLQAVIDLSSPTKIRHLSANFLQNQSSWVFLPVSVEFALSDDGVKFTVAATLNNDVPADREGTIIKEFGTDLPSAKARYVRIQAKSLSLCPPWHRAAGRPCWLLADEVVVE